MLGFCHGRINAVFYQQNRTTGLCQTKATV
jgi:hypothetical protein